MKQFAIVLMAAALLGGCADRRAGTAARTGPVYTTAADPGLLPAGTTLEVRTNEAIEADTTTVGRTYSGQLTQPIMTADGRTVAPAGSPVRLAVIGVQEGGTVTTDRIQLGIQSITIGGRSYPVQTEVVETEQRGLGATRRTAEMVGGGAALGTLVGAIAGGGTGALIGGITGAAAGAAIQVLTQGDEVRVPAEAVMTFRLDQPIRIQGLR
jgi:hypothetical protein